MREAIKRLDIEYGFGLSEDEIDWIAEETEKMRRLFQSLYEIDVTGIAPMARPEKRVKL